MSHVGRTGVDGMVRVLSVAVPLRHDVPPSAVGLMRDPVADLVDRLSCVVNNAVQFEHAVAVYRLRALVVTINGQRRNVPVNGGLAVSLVVASARHGSTSVVVVGDMDVRMTMATQRAHQYWCWHLMGLLDVAWGAPTENHHAPVTAAPGYRALADALAARSHVPHCASLPWHRVRCGEPGCWIQGGEVLMRPPDDVRGVVVRGGCRAEMCRALQRMADVIGAVRVLVVAPSPVLRQWWTAALPGDRFVCRVAHDMLGGDHVSETWSVVVWDAVQPFPLQCAEARPTVGFSVVLARPHTGVNATRTEHALCRLVGLGPAQVQGLLVPPASCVLHRGESCVQASAVHAHEVDLPDDLRALVEQLGRPDVHMGAVVDNTPFVAASVARQGVMFGTVLSRQDVPPGDAALLACPMCEIEDACGDWPLLKLVGCAHAVCLKHLRLWPNHCAVCRAPIEHGVAQMPVVRRTGAQVETTGAGGTVVTPHSVRHQLNSAVARYWAQGGAMAPKLGRCADDAENRYRAGGAVVVVAAHDAAVVHVADALRSRGVPVRIWLGVADAVPGGDGDGDGDNRFVLCLAQRMVCSAARLAWIVPGADRAVPHAVCLSSTVPVLSLVRMLGGCRRGGTVTYVVYRDTPEARDMQQRVAEFRQACPGVQVHGDVAVV